MFAAANAAVVAGSVTSISASLACTVATRMLGAVPPRAEAERPDEREQRAEPEQPTSQSPAGPRALPRLSGHAVDSGIERMLWIPHWQTDDLVHRMSSWNTPWADLPSLPFRSSANRYGTTSRVVGVANNRPPMTARASAAFCSSPAPPIAIGIMPTIIAAAVIRTGRIRVCPASIAA